jgi:hypothetical protein
MRILWINQVGGWCVKEYVTTDTKQRHIPVNHAEYHTHNTNGLKEKELIGRESEQIGVSAFERIPLASACWLDMEVHYWILPWFRIYIDH